MNFTLNDEIIFCRPDVFIIPIVPEKIKPGIFLQNQQQIPMFNDEICKFLDLASKIAQKQDQHIFQIGEELFAYCLLTSVDFSTVKDFFQKFLLNSFSAKFAQGFVIGALPEGCSGSAIFYQNNKKEIEIVRIFMGYFQGQNVQNWNPSYMMMSDDGFKEFIRKFSKKNISDGKMSQICAFSTTQPIIAICFYLNE